MQPTARRLPGPAADVLYILRCRAGNGHLAREAQAGGSALRMAITQATHTSAILVPAPQLNILIDQEASAVLHYWK